MAPNCKKYSLSDGSDITGAMKSVDEKFHTRRPIYNYRLAYYKNTEK